MTEPMVLENDFLKVHLISTGAAIKSLHWKGPCLSSKLVTPGSLPLVLGYPDESHYGSDTCYCGMIVGRTAGRIGSASFDIRGRKHQLTANWGEKHHIHGGSPGLSHQRWELVEASDQQAVFSMDSPDGDQGYPGLLGIVVTYSLSDADLNIHFQATTDKTTHVNLTSHPYFNLSGSAESPIDDHLLMLCSQSFLETNSEQIPTGRVIPTVDGSLDFATARSIGNTRLDHTFLLSRWQDTRKGQLDLAAVLYCPSSGIGCRILTDLPALQVYSGEHLPAPFLARRGLALEAQYPPNACNLEGLPSTLLEPGTVYNHTIRYSFANDVGFD